MVTTIPAENVTTSSVFVDRKGKHTVDAVRRVRGKVALSIDGFWNYYEPKTPVNIVR